MRVATRRWLGVVVLVAAAAACKPTEAQQAAVRARFAAADAADAEPDRAFAALAQATRTAKTDGPNAPCSIEWTSADRERLVAGLSRWLADSDIGEHPLQPGTRFVQADNVTIVDHEAPLTGSASRARRRGLEAELLERKGALGDLSGKEFVARADSISNAPLAPEIVIELLSVKEPAMKEDDKFTSGFALARVYLYDPASSRFVCSRSFTAASSDVVDERAVHVGKYWIDVNFYLNVVDAAGEALRK